jgi:hypothetical protein
VSCEITESTGRSGETTCEETIIYAINICIWDGRTTYYGSESGREKKEKKNMLRRRYD